jgi:hypothetical protein
MPKIGACLAISALAATLVAPSATMAVGLRIGPVHVGLPLFRVRHRIAHRHHHVALRTHIRHRAGSASARAVERGSRSVGGGESAPNNDAAVLYPSLAVPSLANDVFWPNRSSPWPFSYDAIFRTTFAKSLPAQDPQSCQGNEPAGLIVARMQSELRPDAVQERLLQKLGGALGMASAALAKACPPGVPVQPVARLQLMQAQVAALSMAVDLIRPPLQQLEQSLNAEQRARFAAAPSKSDGAIACGTANSTDWSIDQISQSVQPGDDQREALADLREAFVSAARDLDVHCPKMLPPDPLARLESIEARLDASWRAVLGMQVALASFENRLTDSQRTRFEAMNVAEAR